MHIETHTFAWLLPACTTPLPLTRTTRSDMVMTLFAWARELILCVLADCTTNGASTEAVTHSVLSINVCRKPNDILYC